MLPQPRMPAIGEYVPIDLQPLFKDVDMEKQGAKLMKVIGVAVMMLDKMDQFKPMLVKLGKKVRFKHGGESSAQDVACTPKQQSNSCSTLEQDTGHTLVKDTFFKDTPPIKDKYFLTGMVVRRMYNIRRVINLKDIFPA